MDDVTAEYDFRVTRPAAPLRHRVTESIRNAIAVGRFAPGERMPERDLCAMTGVSRTLVREALRQLESEGLIKVQAHRGPVVSEFTPRQALGIYQVREVLEGLAAELFAVRAVDSHRKALLLAFEEVKEAYESGDIVVRLAAKNRFYDCIIEGSGNEALGSSLHIINSRIMLLRGRSLQTAARRRTSLGELQDLIDAMMRQDPKAARRASRRHVRNAASTAVRSLRADLRAQKRDRSLADDARLPRVRRA